MTVKHSGDEAFLFYFPVPTQTQQESGFIVFLQYDTSSYFKLILSPSVCDFSVADFQISPKKGHSLFTTPLLVFSSADFYSTCIPEGSIGNIYGKTPLCEILGRTQEGI